MTPDVTGTYVADGTSANDRPRYVCTAGGETLYLAWRGDAWVVSQEGEEGPLMIPAPEDSWWTTHPWWQSATGPTGTFTPAGTATGTLTVSQS